ncbi:hypothetical protein K6U06_06645 [Acidiferrimicrobium sp. IK]|uniref:hypothetical protein n=1 Tax=Acidiferrimicrobium sp. IK TaxID=2871700 RepID=UPI0021CAE9F0|nr:hypothetical protein [Acidiferrimicrobium sp. IK]MCU4184032.1 hypothetical protein [Acidiferrimicrobium sp. IK]
MTLLPADTRPLMVCAEDRYQPDPAGPAATAAEAVVDRFWRHQIGVPGNMRNVPKGPWPTGTHLEMTAAAYVNHGRWMVDCPHGCGSAQYASHADRRMFCVECSSGGTGLWITVSWPSPADVAAIEAALSCRLVPNRNWRPGETVEQLHAQNAFNGAA